MNKSCHISLLKILQHRNQMPNFFHAIGYGFVDFENATAAENSVKGLQAKGIQAQMAKQQEPDPTNLYFANLPPNMNEDELKKLLHDHGFVTSTRILRENNESKCAGFARYG